MHNTAKTWRILKLLYIICKEHYSFISLYCTDGGYRTGCNDYIDTHYAEECI